MLSRFPTAELLIFCVALAAYNFAVPSALSQVKRPKSDADINKIGQRKITGGPNFYSPQSELNLGSQLAQEVERHTKTIDDAIVVAYVDQLSQEISKNSDTAFPIIVRVIDTETIGAFTLPGGHLYINKGLFLQTETEAELASVFAYGTACTALRSGTHDATKAEVMQLAVIPLILMGPAGWGGSTASQQANLTIPITYLKFQRDSVFDADYFGLQYLYKSGYDPESMPRFLERVWPLTPAGSGNIPKVFSSFPPLDDRLKAMRIEIQKILPQHDTTTVSNSEFEAAKEHLRAWSPPRSKDADSTKPILRKPSSKSSKFSFIFGTFHQIR